MMDAMLAIITVVFVVLLVIQAWRCLACAFHIGPFGNRRKPRTDADKFNAFMEKVAAGFILGTSINIAVTFFGG